MVAVCRMLQDVRAVLDVRVDIVKRIKVDRPRFGGVHGLIDVRAISVLSCKHRRDIT